LNHKKGFLSNYDGVLLLEFTAFSLILSLFDASAHQRRTLLSTPLDRKPKFFFFSQY